MRVLWSGDMEDSFGEPTPLKVWTPNAGTVGDFLEVLKKQVPFNDWEVYVLMVRKGLISRLLQASDPIALIHQCEFDNTMQLHVQRIPKMHIAPPLGSKIVSVCRIHPSSQVESGVDITGPPFFWVLEKGKTARQISNEIAKFVGFAEPQFVSLRYVPNKILRKLRLSKDGAHGHPPFSLTTIADEDFPSRLNWTRAHLGVFLPEDSIAEELISAAQGNRRLSSSSRRYSSKHRSENDEEDEHGGYDDEDDEDGDDREQSHCDYFDTEEVMGTHVATNSDRQRTGLRINAQ